MSDNINKMENDGGVEEERETTVKLRYRKVAPEGGWGYLVGVGMALSFVSVHALMKLGPRNSFPLILGRGPWTYALVWTSVRRFHPGKCWKHAGGRR